MNEQWYYKIELEKDNFTNGRLRHNVSMVRQLLKGLDVTGLSCIDIGTQESIIPVLLKKRGAGEVYAYDRFEFSDRIEKVKKAYDVDFNYISDILIDDLKDKLIKKRRDEQFDLVVFSGILYHLIDPLGGMAIARSLCKIGGMFVIETSAFVTDEMALYFNDKGKYYPQTNYFQISIGLLDYFLRMLHLKPIDYMFRIPPKNKDIARVTVVCEAQEQGVNTKDDSWMNKSIIKRDFMQKQLNYEGLRRTDSKLNYNLWDKDRLVFRPQTGSVDLYATTIKCDQTPIFEDLAYLSLKDQY